MFLVNTKTAVINSVSCRYPNLKSVRELVYKRGFGKVDGRRIALTNNENRARRQDQGDRGQEKGGRGPDN